jgi:hypothetical protein
MLGYVDGTDLSDSIMGEYPSQATLASEGGISVITPADTDWDASVQCPSHAGNPSNSPSDLHSSGLTNLHVWVIECFYDAVMPAGYREAL